MLDSYVTVDIVAGTSCRFWKNKFERAIEMRKYVQTTLVLTIGIVFVIMLLAGCQQQGLSDTKKSRLVANENRQLKEQLARSDREIKKQKEILENCLEEKKNLKAMLHGQIKNLMEGALEKVSRESAELRKENEGLRAQIEELKKHLEEK